MNTRFLLPILCVLLISCKQGTEQNSIESEILRLDEFTFANSKYIEDKTYHVYLPPSYFKKEDKQYPVLYMMDGQVQFGGVSPYSKASWDSHKVMDSLVAANTVQEVIMVGINHAGEKRFMEYMPQKPVETLPKEAQDSMRHNGIPIFSDDFLSFLTKELKPQIDKKYRTLSDVENTFVGGSSMGGLISMYATCEYPEIFGGAICMSTHWIIAYDDSDTRAGESVVQYFKENLPEGKEWYFDYGTEGLDQYYGTLQSEVDGILEAKQGEKNWLSKKYEGHNHNEQSWNERLYIPFEFMFGEK